MHYHRESLKKSLCQTSGQVENITKKVHNVYKVLNHLTRSKENIYTECREKRDINKNLIQFITKL